MSGGHDPEEFLEWSNTKYEVAAQSAIALERWKLEQMWGK